MRLFIKLLFIIKLWVPNFPVNLLLSYIYIKKM